MTEVTAVSGWLRRRAMIDRGLGAVGSVALSPVIAALAFAVRRADGATGLIRVDRVGHGGRRFRMWKVRSMRPAAADGTAAGPALTASTDDRVTPIGRRLRQFHLDEAPQVFNVALGEMLLLGPRPESPQWVDDSDRRWDAVLQVSPGIAGPTQLIIDAWERSVIDLDPEGNAYVDEVLPVKQAVDAWYVRAATPGLDLLVLSSLVGRVVFRRPPLRLERRIRRDVPEAGATLDWVAAHR